MKIMTIEKVGMYKSSAYQIDNRIKNGFRYL